MSFEESKYEVNLDLKKAIEYIESKISRELTETERAFFVEGFKFGGISGMMRFSKNLKEDLEKK